MQYIDGLIVLLLCRGADLLSTWMVTPKLMLEANMLVRMLGWRGTIFLNVVLSAVFALSECGIIMTSVASLLVAISNTHNAWMVKAMGEQGFDSWSRNLVKSASTKSYLFCAFSNLAFILSLAILIAFIGDFSQRSFYVAAGVSIYGLAVSFHTLFSL